MLRKYRSMLREKVYAEMKESHFYLGGEPTDSQIEKELQRLFDRDFGKSDY